MISNMVGWNDAQVRQLQKDLNAWGFRDNEGNRLSTDGNYGDKTRFAHRMYFRQRDEFLSQGHTRAEWEQHLKDRAAGTDKVPIKAPASGTSGAGSYNATKPKCDSEQIFVSEVTDYLKGVVYSAQGILFGMAKDLLSSFTSFSGIQGGYLSTTVNAAGNSVATIRDARNAINSLGNEVGLVGRAAIKGVAGSLSIIIGTLDFVNGLSKMIEATKTVDQALKLTRYYQGAAGIFTGISGAVAGISGLLGAVPVAVGASALAFMGSISIGYLRGRERQLLGI